jgi:hypothetical protein
MIYIICTKLELVKLEGHASELKQQTEISRGKNTNGSQLGNYPYSIIRPNGFLQC